MIIQKLIAILGFITFIIICITTIKDHIWYEEEYKIQGWKYCGPIGKITIHCSDEERKRLIEKHNKINKERAEQYRKSQERKEKFCKKFCKFICGK